MVGITRKGVLAVLAWESKWEQELSLKLLEREPICSRIRPGISKSIEENKVRRDNDK